MKVVGVFAKDSKFLGCAENALGLREYLESNGHTYIVTDDKEGEDSGAFSDLRSFGFGLGLGAYGFWRFCRAGEACSGHGHSDHHAVSSGVHDAGAAEEGGEAEADLDGGRGVGPHRPAHGGREGHDGGGGVGQQRGVGRGGRAHAHPHHGAQLLARAQANLRRRVDAFANRAFDLQGKTVGTVGSGRIGQELLKRLKVSSYSTKKRGC
jgi:formate dehydrogenase